ncbi:MAG: hypothetical protein AAFN77_17815 [Planctomycetota bacterium]
MNQQNCVVHLRVSFAMAVVFVIIGSGDLMGQTSQQRTQPFVGFQSFDGSRFSVDGSVTDNRNPTAAASRYAYPGRTGASGSVPSRTQVGSQMRRSDVATGNLNHFGTATSAVPTGTRSGPSTIYRGQARLTSRTSQVPVRPTAYSPPQTTQQPTPAQPRAMATRSGTGQRSPRLNEMVVQQTSSTVSGNRVTVAKNPTARSQQVIARPAQNCVCVPNYVQPNVTQGQTFRQSNVAANQAPSLAGSTAFAQQPNYQFQPGLGVPQFGTRGNVLTPFVTGSGVYTPLLPLVSQRPGTYMGQGIIGQPTAYVDGQPLRNLLRYISP